PRLPAQARLYSQRKSLGGFANGRVFNGVAPRVSGADPRSRNSLLRNGVFLQSDRRSEVVPQTTTERRRRRRHQETRLNAQGLSRDHELRANPRPETTKQRGSPCARFQGIPLGTAPAPAKDAGAPAPSLVRRRSHTFRKAPQPPPTPHTDPAAQAEPALRRSLP